MNQTQDKVWTQTDIERYIAEKLCDSREDARVLDADRESPDCLISINGEPVGLELTTILNPSKYDTWKTGHRGKRGFSKFSRYAQSQIKSDSRAKEAGQIGAWPRIGPHPTKEDEEIWKSPDESDYETCYKELIELSERYSPERNQEWFDVYFAEDYPEENREAGFAPDDRPRLRWINSGEYPTLQKYFMCFQVWGGNGGLNVWYSEFEKVELNEDQVRETISSHHDKLPAYRSNLQKDGFEKCPVWLLLYSEGYEQSRIIPKWDSCTERIKEIYCEVVSIAKTDGFDELWLGTDVMLGDSLVEGRPPSTSFQRLVWR